MVELKGVSISYGNEEAVLKDISFGINAGECVVFAGKSGSGKTSIINTINGLGVRYDGANITGEILLEGKRVNELETYEISKIVSTVFQNPKTYFFNVNTTHELLFYLENLGICKEEMEKRLQDMLNIFGIEELLNRDIFKLSGGEKQILCIASCYMAGTKMIVLDEPSSNLDAKYISILESILKLLKEKGISIVLSEHRLYYLMDVADRFFVVNNKSISEYSNLQIRQMSEETRLTMGLRDVKKSSLDKPRVGNRGELEIKNLEIAINSKKDRLIIKDIAFELGKIYGIVGYNGVGKSTFVRSLIGVNPKSKEEIFFRNKKIGKKERLKKSALVMQDVNHQLFTSEVKEEVVLGVKKADKDKAEKLLLELGLKDKISCHPFSLSGGEKQRVVISAVLFKNSIFNFFDEPTSGMDLNNMKKISKIIKEASNQDNIFFVVSHDIEFLNETVDYVIDIKDYNVKFNILE